MTESSSLLAASKRKPLSDRQGDEFVIAKRVCECGYGAPAGAVASGDDGEVKHLQCFHRVCYDPLIRTGKVKPAQDSMKWRVGAAGLGVLQHVDDPGVRAGRVSEARCAGRTRLES